MEILNHNQFTKVLVILHRRGPNNTKLEGIPRCNIFNSYSMQQDWALALVKGNREPHESKKKSFDLGGNRTHDLRIRSTVTLPTELQGRTEKVGDDFRW